MIELKTFYKSYYSTSRKNPVFTVQDISLKVETGKIVGLLGPNGSGKTTIMKAICGFHYPSSGQILISDNQEQLIDIQESPEKAMSFIGYVPEKSILPPDMYVYNFLENAGKIHGLSEDKLKKQLDFVIKECSLEDVLSKKIKTLSKGYAQRVSFAQAIIYNPPNLILDEPVSGLDPLQIIQMRNLIKKMSETKAVILSTHILQEVYSLCDEMYIINNGVVCAKGTEKEILSLTSSKDLETAFLKLTKNGGEK